MGNQTKPNLDARAQRVLDHLALTHRTLTAPGFLRTVIQSAAIKDAALGSIERAKMFDSSTREGQAHRDAAGIALGEELKKISAFNTRYVEQQLKSAQQIAEVPDAPSIGFNEYAWAFISNAGSARWSDELEGNFPEAIVTREGRNTTILRNALAGYGYSDLDLARAALIPGFALPREKSMRAARMVAEATDTAMYTGAAGGVTLPALLNQTTIVQANYNNTGGALSTLSADNLYAFYQARFNAYIANFGDAPMRGWWVLLPLAEMQRIDQTFVGTGKQYSVKELLMRAFGDYGLQGFDHNRHCATAGTGSSAMMCIYPRDGLCVGRVVAATYLESEPQRSGFNTEIKAYGRVGGLAFREPESVYYAYNL